MQFQVQGFNICVNVTKYKDGEEIFTKPYGDLTEEEKREFSYNATLKLAKNLYEDENHSVKLTRVKD